MVSIPMRQLHSTLIAALLVAAICSTPMMGIFLPLIVFAQFLCVPFFAWTYFKRPEQRRLHVIQSAIWLLVPLIILCSHFIQYKMARARADEIVSSITQFISTTGRCPHSLEEVHLSRQVLRERLLMAGYSCESDPHPLFYYSVGYAPFAMYNYDFDKREWYIND